MTETLTGGFFYVMVSWRVEKLRGIFWTGITKYWMFTLFNAVAVIVLMALGALVRMPALVLVYGLAVIIPSLAVQFRRLHDRGRSGWWMFIALVPWAGAIVLLMFYLFPSDPGMNRYGTEPAISRSRRSSASL